MLHLEQLMLLIFKDWQGKTTAEEKAQLQEWINADPQNAAMLKRFENLNWVIERLKKMENAPRERAKQKLWGSSSTG